MVFYRYCNYLVIKYELDEFALNWMNVYVWYDVVLIFVNDVVCDRDIVFSGKEIPVLSWDY